MKQIFYQRGKGIRVEEVPAPVCKENGVLVAFFSSLISSGTESHAVEKGIVQTVQEKPDLVRKTLDTMRKQGVVQTLNMVANKMKELIPLGYSAAGTVVDVGAGVKDVSAGDRVACAGVGYANHAEYGYVPRNLLARIPDNVDYEEAAFVSLGAIALQAVRRAALEIGSTVYVLGLGLIGQLTAQILEASGVKVIGADLIAERVKLAKSLGVTSALLINDIDPQESVFSATAGRGVDAIIVCASSSDQNLLNNTLHLGRDRCRMVLLGDVPISLKRDIFYLKEMDLAISRSYGPGRYDAGYEEGGKDYPYAYVRWTENRNMQEFLSLIAEKRVNVSALISDRFSVEDATQAYQVLHERPSRCMAVLIKYKSANERPTISRKTIFAAKRVEKDKIGISIVGTGDIVRSVHLPNLKKIYGFDVQGILSASGHGDPNLCKRYGARFFTSDYNEVLDDPNTDCVLVASRHNLHASMVIDAVKKGKHVLVEKPIAINEEECVLLLNATTEQSTVVQVGFNRRFSPAIRMAKTELRQAQGPKMIMCRINSRRLPLDHWTNLAEEGGGMLLGEGCHFLDLFYFLLEEEPIAVSAHSINDNGRTAPFSNFILDLEFEKGSVASLVYTTFGSPLLPKERIEIFYGGCSIIIDDFKQIEILKKGSVKKGFGRTQKGLYEELEAFASYIRKGEPAVPGIREGVRATRCALKAMESLKRRNRLPIVL